MENKRRSFIKNSIALPGLLTLPELLKGETKAKSPKVVCVGGHPDDPETGCGGTLARISKMGYPVTNIYLTTGEAGISGKSHKEAAKIRRKESILGSKALGAKPVFAGQIDGDTVVNNKWIKKMHDLLSAENPDIVFTQWPIDKHPDHQSASMLVLQALRLAKYSFSLYFYEVLTGRQTMVFHPTDYVDITATREQKKKAVYCHASQDPAALYGGGHAEMEKFRGMQFGTEAAEAFVRMTGKGLGALPL